MATGNNNNADPTKKFARLTQAISDKHNNLIGADPVYPVLNLPDDVAELRIQMMCGGIHSCKPPQAN